MSITNSRSLLKLMSIESVMPSNHLILCRPFLLLPSIFPSITVFSNKSVLCIRWPSTGVIVVVVYLLSHVQLFCDPIDKVDCKAALAMGFPSKNTGVGLPLDQRIFLGLLLWQVDSPLLSHQGSPWYTSVQFSHSIMSDSLRPQGLQHTRPPCPSPTPGVYSNSCPLSL